MDNLPFPASASPLQLTRKDFASDQEVRWCPGCGDYSILAQVQKTLPSLGIPKENVVFVSGIGCSSRFTYYMNTYGVHGIHGRALPIATGIKLARPELSVWVVTGDGDALAIGGNHLMHTLRRNVGLKILLLNNRIYGLTKGQCSPTTLRGTRTKTTPIGSIDQPLDPMMVALGCGATFVARVRATDSKGLQEVLTRAHAHEGTAFIEIQQDCVIFSPDAFESPADAGEESRSQLVLRHGQPLRFGKDLEYGIALSAQGTPELVALAKNEGRPLLVHDETSMAAALQASSLMPPAFPTPFGVLRAVPQPSYEARIAEQRRQQSAPRGSVVQGMLESGATWTVD